LQFVNGVFVCGDVKVVLAKVGHDVSPSWG